MPGFWRKCRVAFRWTRYCFWLLVVLVIFALTWVNVVGFPDFVKQRLAAAVQQRGVTLEFSRMRWRFIHGIVAENVIIGDRQVHGQKPLLTAGQIQLRLDYGAMLQRKFQLSGVVVRDGIFTLPVTPTDRFALLNMQGEVRFLPDDTWSLDELKADFSGVKIRLAGQMAHATDVTKWQLFAGQKPGGGQGALAKPLRDFSDTLVKIKFTGQPQISATFNGDARDVHSFTLQVNASVPAVTSPWFGTRDLQFAASVTAPLTAPTNFDASLAFWTNALPFQATWTARAAGLELQSFSARTIECGGEWNAPRLAVTKFSAHFGGGNINLAAGLDVATRELDFTNASAFDPHSVKLFLPESARGWLAEILWTQPPSLAVDGLLTLPAWTNSAADWRGLIGPAARLHGELACTNAVVHGHTLDLLRTHFNYANQIWGAPDLKLTQGRTQLEFSGEESAVTDNIRAALRGYLDAESVRPFIPTNISTTLFHIVKLDEPVAFDLNISGNLRNLNSLSVTGRVAVTNFTLRSEVYESAAADVTYTNRVLEFYRPHSLRAHGTQMMTADAVALDWNAGMYYFSNGFSTTDPMAVVRAIGPKTAGMIAPYEFLEPPVARVHGQLPLRDINRGRDLEGTDLTFDIIQGVPFRWTKLSTTNIMGTIHWTGQDLQLTNITGSFYGGDAGGNAHFDFHPVGYDCNFQFEVFATNVDVRLLGLALATNPTNLIEGRLTGHAAITDANSKGWRSWNGYGEAELHNGLLWNIPIFGFASPLLNTVTPGLGNSRATDASAKIAMTNGVAWSDSLEIHTITMRLQYVGSVDLEQNTKARVTAQLLRNTPVIGSVISVVLSPFSKIFECEVTGQISDPKVTPIYLPRYLLMPLHPIRSLEEIIPSSDKDKPKG